MHERVPIERPCKVHDARSGKYVAGVTRNVSEGGMLIELSRGVPIGPGDEVYVGVAQKRRQALLRADEMVRVRVARAVGTPSGCTMLGVELVRPAMVDEVSLRQAA